MQTYVAVVVCGSIVNPLRRLLTNYLFLEGGCCESSVSSRVFSFLEAGAALVEAVGPKGDLPFNWERSVTIWGPVWISWMNWRSVLVLFCLRLFLGSRWVWWFRFFMSLRGHTCRFVFMSDAG